jgi:hypothetical protein
MNQINPNHHFVESKVVSTGAIAKVIPNRAKRPGVRQRLECGRFSAALV